MKYVRKTRQKKQGYMCLIYVCVDRKFQLVQKPMKKQKIKQDTSTDRRYLRSNLGTNNY